jgi:hypothetical protein
VLRLPLSILIPPVPLQSLVILSLTLYFVLAVDETVSRQVRSQVRSCGIYGGQSGIGADIFRVLWLPLPILIPPNVSYSSIIRGGTIGQLVGDVPSGLSLNPPHEIN